MTCWIWRGRNEYGRLCAGAVRAQSRQAARMVLSLRKVTVKQCVNRRWLKWHSRALNQASITQWYDKLSTLLGAQVELVDAIVLLRDSEVALPMIAMLDQLEQGLKKGLAFSEIMAEQPTLFSTYARALVAVGEKTGQLAMALNRLSQSVQKSEVIRSKLSRAMQYPMWVCITALVVMVGLLIGVVPALSQMFIQSNVPLPWPTQCLLIASQWLQNYGGYLALFICGSTALFLRSIKHNNRVRCMIQACVLHIPSLGRLWTVAQWAKLFDALAMASSAGLDMAESLHLTRTVISLHWLEQLQEQTLGQLRQGQALSMTWGKSSKVDNTIVQFMKVAEQTAAFSQCSEALARIYQREFDQRLTRVMAMIEPMMFVFLGLSVGAMLVALYLPIFNMGQVL